MKRRELVIFPLAIAIVGLFVYLIGDSIQGEFAKIFFPQNDSVFEFLKLYFTTFIIIYFAGIFTDVKVINGYLISRVVSSIVMIVVTILLSAAVYFIFYVLSYFVMMLIFLVSIWVGQLVAYLMQTRRVRYADSIAVVLQVLITILFTYYTFFPVNNFLFFD